MSVKHWLDVGKRRVIAEVRGMVTMPEMIEAIDGSLSDPAYEPGFDIYSDHSDISEAISTEQVKRLAGHLQTLAPKLKGSRWAIVTRKQVSYGMMRMLSVHVEGVPMEIRVFYDPADAEAWLESPRC